MHEYIETTRGLWHGARNCEEHLHIISVPTTTDTYHLNNTSIFGLCSVDHLWIVCGNVLVGGVLIHCLVCAMGFFRRAKSTKRPDQRFWGDNNNNKAGKKKRTKSKTGDDSDTGSIGQALAPQDQFYLEIPNKKGPIGILRTSSLRRKRSKKGSSDDLALQDILEQASTVSELSFGSARTSHRGKMIRSKSFSKRKKRSIQGNSIAGSDPREQQQEQQDRNPADIQDNDEVLSSPRKSVSCCVAPTPEEASPEESAPQSPSPSPPPQESSSLFSWVCGVVDTSQNPLYEYEPYPTHSRTIFVGSSNATTVSASQSQYGGAMSTNALFDALDDDADSDWAAGDDMTAHTKESRWKRRLRKVRSIPKLSSQGLKPSKWAKRVQKKKQNAE
eukprot:Nitzschia sp. Nitz4//scaffold165_size50357//10534//11697//NITZ4_007015-RA/size50357-processed-gene-0.45-mRNA-1//1//CDS//3329538114//8565//frame0